MKKAETDAEKEEDKQPEPEDKKITEPEEKQEEPKEEKVLKPFYWACTAANKGQPYDRIRKDYNDLTVAERKCFISKRSKIFKVAGKYDMFVALHKFANNDVYAHSSGGFYPWHRKFLLEFENMLRSLKEEYKCVTIPFWDWAQESKVCDYQQWISR